MTVLRKLILSLALPALLHISLSGQVINDSCLSATLVNPDSCWSGSTLGATDTWFQTVGCQTGGDQPDVWYSFIATESQLNYSITSVGTWSGQIEFMLVEAAGICTGLTARGSNCGPSPLSGSVQGLLPGQRYYFTISNQAGHSTGSFDVCLESIVPTVIAGQDCNTAAIICSPQTTGHGPSGEGPGIQELTTTNSCWKVGGENYSSWFKFSVGCDGKLEFSILPNSEYDDYDFAIWDITSDPENCSSMGNSIACNWSGCTGSTGLSDCPELQPGAQTCDGPADDCFAGEGYRAWSNWSSGSGCNGTFGGLDVTAGHVYALLIDNYSGSGNGFSLTFGGLCGNEPVAIGPDARFMAVADSSSGCKSYSFSKLCTVENSLSIYQWSFGDGSSSTQPDPVHTYTGSGVFTVTLEVTDLLGCSNTYLMELDIPATCAQGPIVMQLITPNGDGRNDVWHIENIDQYSSNITRVFNRWGNEVFKASPYMGDWDGQSAGIASVGNGTLPTGTYFYLIDLYGDGSELLSGFIELQN